MILTRRNNAWFVLLVAITCLPVPGRAQNTFPLDGNENLALRIHDWYRQSQARLGQLEADRIKVKGFITEVAPASTMVGTAIAPEDVARLAQINEDIAREQARCRLLEAAWEKNRAVPPAPARSFVWRYGPLSESGQRSTDPKYDRIEYAIRNFRFNETTPPPANATPPEANAAPRLAGRWEAFAGGKKTGDCTITQDGNQLTFVIDRTPPERSSGRFLDPTTVIADQWGPQRGRVNAGGRRIDWDSSYWQRKD